MKRREQSGEKLLSNRHGRAYLAIRSGSQLLCVIRQPLVVTGPNAEMVPHWKAPPDVSSQETERVHNHQQACKELACANVDLCNPSISRI